MAVRQISDNAPDGQSFGSTPADKISFYGVTPIVQPSAAAQAAITDSSGGTANPATGVAAVGGAYSQTVLANALATLIAQTNAIRTALVSAGLMKGS